MSRKHMALFLSIWVWEVAGIFHFHFYKKRANFNKVSLAYQEERFEIRSKQYFWKR